MAARSGDRVADPEGRGREQRGLDLLGAVASRVGGAAEVAAAGAAHGGLDQRAGAEVRDGIGGKASCLVAGGASRLAPSL